MRVAIPLEGIEFGGVAERETERHQCRHVGQTKQADRGSALALHLQLPDLLADLRDHVAPVFGALGRVPARIDTKLKRLFREDEPPLERGEGDGIRTSRDDLPANDAQVVEGDCNAAVAMPAGYTNDRFVLPLPFGEHGLRVVLLPARLVDQGVAGGAEQDQILRVVGELGRARGIAARSILTGRDVMGQLAEWTRLEEDRVLIKDAVAPGARADTSTARPNGALGC